MNLQSMSEKIAQSVSSILRRDVNLRILRGKCFESFNVQNHFYGCAFVQVRELSPLQQSLPCFAIKTLPYTQQTQ